MSCYAILISRRVTYFFLQAAQDGVDIISLSITPNRRPPGIATFFNPIDMALLSAVKAGIFVVQAAGNTGPSYKSISSFSPWIFTVGAAAHDRTYSNSIVLGNNVTIPGIGLAPGTDKDAMCTLVSAVHALNETVDSTDLYLGECQDPNQLIQELVQGNILICMYTVRFVLGLSSIKQALDTAENLSAAGVVFLVDPFVTGFQLNPMPMKLPGLIISSADNSKVGPGQGPDPDPTFTRKEPDAWASPSPFPFSFVVRPRVLYQRREEEGAVVGTATAAAGVAMVAAEEASAAPAVVLR
ncbi:Subtilisin-like protease SBT2-2 [Nymphaea thermarum]|nr:Subtilisin-like protease SBT2-2 [Nymphaea thermarum]